MSLHEQIKETVRERDNFTCQKCFRIWSGKEKQFDVHHLELKMEGLGSKNTLYDLQNMNKLITYCHKCHMLLPHLIKYRQFGSKKGTPKKEKRNLLIKTWLAKGKSQAFIGKQLGITRQRVWQLARK